LSRRWNRIRRAKLHDSGVTAGEQHDRSRLNTALLGSFAGLALLLAVVGINGVILVFGDATVAINCRRVHAVVNGKRLTDRRTPALISQTHAVMMQVARPGGNEETEKSKMNRPNFPGCHRWCRDQGGPSLFLRRI
jgi:hypothetical protein